MKQAAAFCCGAVAALLFWSLAGPVLAAGGRTVSVEPNVRVYIDGQPLAPPSAQDAEAFVCDGVVYLPAGAVCEALGRRVRWDDGSRSVYIW